MTDKLKPCPLIGHNIACMTLDEDLATARAKADSCPLRRSPVAEGGLLPDCVEADCAFHDESMTANCSATNRHGEPIVERCTLRRNTRRAEAALANEPEQDSGACVWRCTPDWWESSCGKEWVITNEAGLKANHWDYCPSCGKPIKEETDGKSPDHTG